MPPWECFECVLKLMKSVLIYYFCQHKGNLKYNKYYTIDKTWLKIFLRELKIIPNGTTTW